MEAQAFADMARLQDEHWWYVGRRAVLAAVLKALSLPPQSKILEVGAGTGGNLELLKKFGDVTAVETDATARRIASERTGISVHDGALPNRLPFPDRSFNLIALFDVLEHVDEDLESLRALRRLLVPGGRLVLTVPAYQWLWSSHDEYLHHKRRYTRSQIKRLGTQAGLVPLRVCYFNSLLLPLAVLGRAFDKLTGSNVSQAERLPTAIINTAFRTLFAAESHLIHRLNFPAGVSVLGVFTSQNEHR